MKVKTSMRVALNQPGFLAHALPGPSWLAWRVLLIALQGEPLTDDERVLFRELTGRDHEPGMRVEEFIGVIGRRGGKSRAIATLLVYTACLIDHSDKLVGGERGVALCLALDQRQAAVVGEYAAAILADSPVLSKLVEHKTQEIIVLRGNIAIETRAASFRRLRGPTYIIVIGDEIAYWWNDEQSANPDTAILDAVRPALMTTGGPLVCISSPHARRGYLWTAYRAHYGAHGDPAILVAHAPSKKTNPTLPQGVIDRALERDLAAASAEYLAQFRSDLEQYIDLDAIERVIAKDVRERPPVFGVTYRAFADPSGGSGDSFTICVGHREGNRAIIDAVREKVPPFSPESTVEEFCALLKTYRVHKVTGDRYAGLWPTERFSAHSVKYEPSEASKSEIYVAMLPLITGQRVSLLDQPRLISQFVALERTTSRLGKDTVDHPRGQHDDIANAVAGCATLLISGSNYVRALMEANWERFYAGASGPYRPLDDTSYTDDGVNYARIESRPLADHWEISTQAPRRQ